MLPKIFAKGNRKTIQNLKELRKMAQADKALRVALRIQGIMLSLEKHGVNDIARLLHRMLRIRIIKALFIHGSKYGMRIVRKGCWRGIAVAGGLS